MVGLKIEIHEINQSLWNPVCINRPIVSATCLNQWRQPPTSHCIRPLMTRWRQRIWTVDEIEVASSLNFSILVNFLYWMCAICVVRKQYWILWKPFISWLLKLDLDNLCFIEVYFVAEGGFFINNTHCISLILVDFVDFKFSIFRPTENEKDVFLAKTKMNVNWQLMFKNFLICSVHLHLAI